MKMRMKRILSTLALAATFLVALAVPAVADYPPAGTTQTPEVLGKTVHAAPGTAFTGSTVIPVVILGLALLMLGTALVLVSRRVRNTAGS
jgi:LPXTG-motif cell wall-anchored protein